jgi:predicted DNA-binding transcriptional regulator AlpA
MSATVSSIKDLGSYLGLGPSRLYEIRKNRFLLFPKPIQKTEWLKSDLDIWLHWYRNVREVRKNGGFN